MKNVQYLCALFLGLTSALSAMDQKKNIIFSSEFSQNNEKKLSMKDVSFEEWVNIEKRHLDLLSLSIQAKESTKNLRSLKSKEMLNTKTKSRFVQACIQFNIPEMQKSFNAAWELYKDVHAHYRRYDRTLGVNDGFPQEVYFGPEYIHEFSMTIDDKKTTAEELPQNPQIYYDVILSLWNQVIVLNLMTSVLDDHHSEIKSIQAQNMLKRLPNLFKSFFRPGFQADEIMHVLDTDKRTRENYKDCIQKILENHDVLGLLTLPKNGSHLLFSWPDDQYNAVINGCYNLRQDSMKYDELGSSEEKNKWKEKINTEITNFVAMPIFSTFYPMNLKIEVITKILNSSILEIYLQKLSFFKDNIKGTNPFLKFKEQRALKLSGYLMTTQCVSEEKKEQKKKKKKKNFSSNTQSNPPSQNKTQTKDFENKIKELNKNISELHFKLKESGLEKNKVETELQENQKQFKESENKLHEVLQKNQKLEKANQRLSQENEKIKQEQKENLKFQQFQQALEKKDVDLKNAKESNLSLTQKIKVLQNNLFKEKDQVLSLTSQIKENKQTNESLKEKLQKISQELKVSEQKEQETYDLNQDLSKKIMMLEEKNKKLALHLTSFVNTQDFINQDQN